MNDNRLKGDLDEVVGTLKQKAGDLTDNTPLKIRGIAQQVKGKIENTWGKAEDAMDEANKETRTQNGERTVGSGPFGGAGRRQ